MLFKNYNIKFYNFNFSNVAEKLPRVDLKSIPKVIKVKAGKDVEIEIPYLCKLN